MNLRIVICLGIISITGGVLGLPEKAARIFGGSTSRITDFPYIVSIRTVDTNQLICAGTIISRWNILTSAHCLILFDGFYGNIRIYAATSSSVERSVNNYQIDRVIFHPQFIRTASEFGILPHDIAIIKLRHYMIFNEYQNKISLPSRAPFTGNVALISGWGVTEESFGFHTSTALRKASVILINSQDCSNELPIRVLPHQFCSFQDHGVGICTGDGGGPVTSNGELYGIITYSFQCAEGLPDIHTQVFVYLDFITNNMQE